MSKTIDLRWQTAFGLFCCGILFGFVFLGIALANSFKLVPGSAEVAMTYADMAAIMLACVSLIITVLGVGVAILAFWGFTNMAKHSREVSRKTANDAVEASLKDGGALHVLAVATVMKITYGHIGIADSSGSNDPTELSEQE